ncbi:MAG: hypothetical protein LBQ47_06790 [Endomicrobium sp.]|jgi:cell division transport system permease protein|nr:hypothetical protein [Endomicrobium sp.]
MRSFYINAASKALKFCALAGICAFAVLFVNHYYALDLYAQQLYSQLAVTVFIDNNHKDYSKLCRDIEDSGILTLDEYVAAAQVYSKAVEKNPFLKDISVPSDAQSFQSYARFLPSVFPDSKYLSDIAKMLGSMEGVDEIVYDAAVFEKYARLKNALSFYKRIGLLFAIIIFMFFAAQSALYILKKEDKPKKAAANAAACLAACAIGFLCVWSVCVFFEHELVIDETAAFLIIFITSFFGIIFKD